MNRESALFLLVGLMFGFIAGYVMHDVMAARQPPRRVASPAAGVAAVAAAPGSTPQQPSQEIARLRQQVAENPHDGDAVLRLANLHYDVQNWPQARELYEQYLGLRPDSPDVITDLGVCYRELGDHSRAVELFGRAQEIQADHWQSRFNEIVVRAFDLKDFETARKILKELEVLEPGNTDVQRLAAEVERRASSG